MTKPLFTGPEGARFPMALSTVTGWDGRETTGEPYGSEESRRAGEAAWQMIDDALRKPTDDSRVRALGECVRRFPSETLRHPEVHRYLEYLSRRRDTAALARILADRPRRGRPARSAAEEFTETPIIEGILAREGVDCVRTGAEIAKREHGDLVGHKSVRAIENDYCRTRHAYRVASQPRWVSGSKLTDAPWQSFKR